VQDVKDRLLASPRKSLRRHSQEKGSKELPKKVKLHSYHVPVVQELLLKDWEKCVRYCSGWRVITVEETKPHEDDTDHTHCKQSLQNRKVMRH
jgi:hypothetical protein